MRLFSNGAFVADRWLHVPDGEAIPIEGWAIVTLKRWRQEQASLAALGVPFGVRVEAGEAIDAVVDDLPRLALIALAFPKFTDGRAYSKARTLREQHGFKGELRAVGEVLLDQMPLMARCGFDTFEVSHGPTLRRLEAGRAAGIAKTYQAAGPTGTAGRRRAATA